MPKDRDNKSDNYVKGPSELDGNNQEGKSLAKDKSNAKSGLDKKDSPIDKLKQAQAGATGAFQGGKALAAAKALQYTKMLIMMAAQFAKGAALGAWGAVTGMAASIAASLGVAVQAVAVAMVGSAILSLAVVGSMVANIIDTNVAQKTGTIVSCEEYIQNLVGVEGLDGEANELKMENARKIVATMRSIGLPDVNIAGILGNFDHESGGLDPTCIEGISSEPHQIGPRKQKAMSDLNNYTLNILFPQYAHLSICKPCYQIGPRGSGVYAPGVGLGQITGGDRAETFYNTAKAVGRDWWDIDYQLAHMLSVDNRVGWLMAWTKPESSPENAGTAFAKYWEGNTKLAQQHRRTLSSQWYVTMKTLGDDADYASSIIDLASMAGGAAINGSASAALDDCVPAQTFDNSDIAEAAASLTYPTREQSVRDPGTMLYQSVYKQIFPSDPVGTQSCDRGVATIVRWAGADDNFLIGSTGDQLNYLRANTHNWQSMGKAGSLHSSGQLKPGDVMVEVGHIVIYTGNEVLSEKFGSKLTPGSEIVHASIRNPPRSLAAAPYYGALDSYNVFRNIKPEVSSKYKGAGGASN